MIMLVPIPSWVARFDLLALFVLWFSVWLLDHITTIKPKIKLIVLVVILVLMVMFLLFKLFN